MATSFYITDSTPEAGRTFLSPNNIHATMTIHAVGGDVTIAQEVNGVYESFETIADGTARILEYGRFGKSIRLNVASAAQVEIR